MLTYTRNKKPVKECVWQLVDQSIKEGSRKRNKATKLAFTCIYLQRLRFCMKCFFMKDSLENSSLTKVLIEDTTQERQNDWEKKLLEGGDIHSRVLKDLSSWYIQTANCCVYPLA